MAIPDWIRKNTHWWPSVHKLNLAYHVCPMKANDIWRQNIAQLKRRMHVFTGRRVVAVVHGPGLESIDRVRRELNDERVEYLELPNDPELRETATFPPMLHQLVSLDESEATFYAHTKGTSTDGDSRAVECWRNAMYHHLLDHIHVCRDLMLTHPCVGTHKTIWPPTMRPPFPTGLNVGDWMYCGAFFWFRHDAVFGHPQWDDVPMDRYGAEAWLSTLFDANEAATVSQPWPVNEYPMPSPYKLSLYSGSHHDDYDYGDCGSGRE